MRQLRDGKVESFPPQDQVRCVMVEHSLQGEDTSLSVLDFVASGRLFAKRIVEVEVHPSRQIAQGCAKVEDQGPAP